MASIWFARPVFADFAIFIQKNYFSNLNMLEFT